MESRNTPFQEYLKTPHGRVFVDKYLQFDPDEEADCILCGKAGVQEWFSFGRFKAVRCCRCQLVYMSPRLSNTKLQKTYETTYEPNRDYEGRLHDMSEKPERERKRRDMSVEIRLTSTHASAGKVLDVGCGAGIYLEALPNTWEKHGVDRAPWAASYTQKVLKIPVQFGEVESLTYPGDFFDVINMTYVIEHLRDPLRTLRILYGWLKKGGLLIVSAPNFGSICAKLFREFYRLVDPCQHLYMFSPKTLKGILREAGFTAKKVYYPYFNTPYCNRRDVYRLFSNYCTKVRLPMLLKSGQVPAVDRLISPPFYGNIMVMAAYKSR